MSWSLFFTNDEQADIPPGGIRIRPTNSDWNNFSFNFNAVISIIPPDNRKPISFTGYVVPLHGILKERNLRNWIKENPGLRRHDDAGNTETALHGILLFATLIGHEQDYSQLAKWVLNRTELNSILSALNDILFLSDSAFSSDIANLLKRNSFSLGVLRMPAAYRSMRRGTRAVLGHQIKALPEVRKSFTFRAQLHGFDEGVHDLSVGFQDLGLFEDRIHCLIGVNGTGKTRLLREFVLSLGKLSGKMDKSFTSFHEYSEAIFECEYYGPLYNRLLVISTAPQNRFPLSAIDMGSFEYQYFNLVNDRSDSGGQNLLTTLMVDLIRDPTEFVGASLTRFALLKRTLRDHIDLNMLYLPVLPDVAHDIGTYQNENGEYYARALDITLMNEQRHLLYMSAVDTARRIGFYKQTGEDNRIIMLHPSSGQSIFFYFALRLISSIDQGTLVIIDEPETHLHPNLICELVTLLYDVLEATKSIALVATHSAYIVREVPTHCVHVFSFEDESKRINIGQVRMRTLGASIDSLSQAVFGDATAKKYHEKFAMDMSKSGMSQEQLLAEYGSVLSPELLIEIRAMRARGSK
ncbi:ATP-binding protein [Massilia sp. LMS1-1-1.1]